MELGNGFSGVAGTWGNVQSLMLNYGASWMTWFFFND
ncbi:hypothetical protein Gogos_003171, partial [Gossypium gossypioides]|nr:hypothetical protein [Gossypium gossypioides]